MPSPGETRRSGISPSRCQGPGWASWEEIDGEADWVPAVIALQKQDGRTVLSQYFPISAPRTINSYTELLGRFSVHAENCLPAHGLGSCELYEPPWLLRLHWTHKVGAKKKRKDTPILLARKPKVRQTQTAEETHYMNARGDCSGIRANKKGQPCDANKNRERTESEISEQKTKTSQKLRIQNNVAGKTQLHSLNDSKNVNESSTPSRLGCGSKFDCWRLGVIHLLKVLYIYVFLFWSSKKI